tara:strand:+ start:399 stop:929 length:531 start_codon:yes stop_codon:yes gene_type:complete
MFYFSKVAEQNGNFSFLFYLIGLAAYSVALYAYIEVNQAISHANKGNSLNNFESLSASFQWIHGFVGLAVFVNAFLYGHAVNNNYQVMFQGLLVIAPGTFNTILIGAFVVVLSFLPELEDYHDFKDAFHMSLLAFISATVGNSIMLAQIFSVAHSTATPPSSLAHSKNLQIKSLQF